MYRRVMSTVSRQIGANAYIVPANANFVNTYGATSLRTGSTVRGRSEGRRHATHVGTRDIDHVTCCSRLQRNRVQFAGASPSAATCMKEPLKSEFTPKLVTLLKQGMSRKAVIRDSLAGVVVGIVAIPLCIAFAIASGVSPDKGLMTGFVAGLLISLLGGSRVQIGGPTGAFVVIVYQIVSEHGVEGLTVATLIAGGLLILMGMMRFGKLLTFFPHTLITGFTAGIAVVIFTSQVKELLGLDMGDVPPRFLDSWWAYLHHFKSVEPTAAIVGIGSVVFAFLFPKLTKAVPGAVVVVVMVTAIQILFKLPIATIGSRFGHIQFGVPELHVGHLGLDTVRAVMPAAIAIALLGGIESLLSAVVADGMIGTRHRPNMELIAQGIANLGSALFGGIPATGAIARTATNVNNGGRTPIAGMVHALTLGCVMFLAGRWVEQIPMACLAGILVVVAYHMSDVRAVRAIFRTNRYEIAVFCTTFGLTVVFDLVLAIQVGMVLAAFLFVKRMADSTTFVESLLELPEDQESDVFDDELRKTSNKVLVYEVQGPLFFGAAQKFFDTIETISDRRCHVLILRLRNVPLIDATGMHRLGEVVDMMHKKSIEVVACEGNASLVEQLVASRILEEGRIAASIDDALQLAALIERDRSVSLNASEITRV